jgi:hypothetical protein
MRWINNTFRFVFRRIAQILSDGSRTEKCFKDKDVNLIAKALREYSGEGVSPTQVYNHLRKWSSEPLRVNQADNVAAKIEGNGFTSAADVKTSIEVGQGSKATELLTSTAGERGRGPASVRMRCL